MKRLILGTLALALLSTTALADTVVVDSVTGAWSAAIGGANVNINNSGSPETIRWGTGGPQSGYNFTGVAPPATGQFSPGDSFTLGTFTHLNNPIDSGTAITGVTLTLTILYKLNGGAEQSLTDVFKFNHDETPNNPTFQDPNCCADIVTVTQNLAVSQTITIGTTDYTFGITGFQYNGGQFTQFSSPEGGTNSALLIGTFDTVQHLAVPGPIVGAGLPGLIAACGGLLTLARRRRQLVV
jgi:hypothetical protein